MDVAIDHKTLSTGRLHVMDGDGEHFCFLFVWYAPSFIVWQAKRVSGRLVATGGCKPRHGTQTTGSVCTTLNGSVEVRHDYVLQLLIVADKAHRFCKQVEYVLPPIIAHLRYQHVRGSSFH